MSQNNWQSIEELDPRKMVLLRNNLFLPGAIFYGRVWINGKGERELFTYRLKKHYQDGFNLSCERHGRLEYDPSGSCDPGWEWCEVPE